MQGFSTQPRVYVHRLLVAARQRIIASSMPAKKYYAVRKGRATGLFETWPECQAQVHGYPGAEFKSFNTAGEALQYVGLAAGAGPGKIIRSNVANTSGSSRFQPYQTAVAPAASIGVMIATPRTLPTPVGLPKPDHDRVISVCLTCGESVEEFSGVRITDVPRTYQVNFDGASRGNPGKAGAGTCIVEVTTGRKVADLACPLPFGCTNNEAEYGGLIVGLQACLSLGIREPYVKGDSNLVVNQVNGTWKVNKDHLRPYHAAACDLLRALAVGKALPQLQHVYREDNAEADRLSNVAVDMQ